MSLGAGVPAARRPPPLENAERHRLPDGYVVRRRALAGSRRRRPCGTSPVSIAAHRFEWIVRGPQAGAPQAIRRVSEDSAADFLAVGRGHAAGVLGRLRANANRPHPQESRTCSHPKKLP